MRTLLACCLLLAAPDLAALEHPFLLWTPDEAAEIRARIADDPDARAQLERMRNSSISKGNPTVWNLFRFVVLEEAEAGEREKEKLLGFIGRKPDPMTWDVDPEKLKWNKGMPSSGDSHMRDEQTLNTLRYDACYHLLSDEERAGVEESLRAYVDFHLSGHKPWHPDFAYDRTSWLPNMHWPRTIGTHLMAVALRDEALIEAMFRSDGGWKWFFDSYLADGRFYMEEFGKYYSNIGTMLMYCEALEKLDLGRYGYGYVGEGGGTMKRYLEMLPWIGLPRLEARPGGTPRYPRVTMGDAGDLHAIVEGIGYPGKKGRTTRNSPFWKGSRMNGPLPKLRRPGWFEIGHRRWPAAGFDYFLAQYRAPGEERYLPSLYWNLGPIDPDEVEPPPAPSYASRERGFALLRAEEGPAYWESPKPAVALQFGMYYVHYVHDCFSILQYVAKNRLIYNKMGRPEGRRGYAGGDDWKDHVRGHCGVVVDGLKAEPVDRGNRGCENQRIREDLAGPGRFVAVRAAGIYPGVDQERALVLTDDYCFDAFRLVSEEARTYDWQVLAFGATVDRGAERWTGLDAWEGRDLRRPHLKGTRVINPGEDGWSVAILQEDHGVERKVGVRVRMLGAPGTLVADSQPPGFGDGHATSLLVSRRAPATAFVALHEPFEGGPDEGPIAGFRRVAENDRGIVAEVTAAGYRDLILLGWGDAIDEPRTLEGEGGSFAFRGFALIRIADDAIRVQGTIDRAKLPVDRELPVIVGGESVEAEYADGVLRF